MIKKHNLVLVPAALLISVLMAGYSFAQNGEASKPIVRNDNNCESNKAFWDYIHTTAGNEGLIIIIARLGAGESSRLFSHRRLHNISTYLHRIREVPKERIITAEGDRSRGRGRVEVYIGGEPLIVFTVGRNQDLHGGSCEETLSRSYYPMQRRTR